MKRVVREFEFSSEELTEVNRLSRALRITGTTAEILYARGMDTEEKMRAFLAPSKERFLPPGLMKGMEEAKLLFAQAREEGWTVVVFGDYDADGIGASAILYRALKEYGIEPYLYVPERSEGYGLTLGAIDNIFDEYMPDLFVTVDCGISNAKEVEYIKEQGAFVIVTDHHELPEQLPACICINPKIQDDYPYDNLCGAGVALKVAVSLIGEKAYGLLDYCALSTVADSVPLLGENRDIVSEGLRLIRNAPRSAFRALLGKTSDEITAQTLAFTAAPRVNAAGRMGNARAALRLFTSDDEEEIALLAEKLKEYNAERQKLCDELYETARAEIKKNGAYKNIVMAVGENWQAGLVGIVAARIAEEFSRPALLFVRSGDMLRGSARSVENINIYEALKACSEYIEEFGGHSQAAGVNVKAENFENLEAALDDYLEAHYTEEDFIPTLYTCGELKERDLKAFAHEIERLEPFGVGNRRPIFTLRAKDLSAAPVKPDSPHLSISFGALDFMYFGGADSLKLLKSGLPKTLAFEYNLSRFRGREYTRGYVRNVTYDGRDGFSELYAFENALLSLKSAHSARTELRSAAELDVLMEERRQTRYGLCAVAYHRKSLEAFPSLRGLSADVFSFSSGGVQNTVLLAPEPDEDFSAFHDVVFLETPAAISQNTGEARVWANTERKVFSGASGWFLPRDALLSVYAALKRALFVGGGCYTEAAKSCGAFGVTPQQFIFAMAVFEELGLLARTEDGFAVVTGQKTDLHDSLIFTKAQDIRDSER